MGVRQRTDCSYSAFIGVGVEPRPFFAEGGDQVLIDKAMLRGDLRRRVAGHASDDASLLKHGDRCPGALEHHRRGDACDAAADDGNVNR